MSRKRKFTKEEEFKIEYTREVYNTPWQWMKWYHRIVIDMSKYETGKRLNSRLGTECTFSDNYDYYHYENTREMTPEEIEKHYAEYWQHEYYDEGEFTPEQVEDIRKYLQKMLDEYNRRG